MKLSFVNDKVQLSFFNVMRVILSHWSRVMVKPINETEKPTVKKSRGEQRQVFVSDFKKQTRHTIPTTLENVREVIHEKMEKQPTAASSTRTLRKQRSQKPK